MNRFKPGDKARVIGNKYSEREYHYFPIGTPVTIIGEAEIYDWKCDDEKGYRQYLLARDLEPIEPVQEEESPWRANMREAEKLVFAARINFQMHHAKEAENDKIDSFLYEAGIEIFNAMDAELESTISRLKSEIEELKRKA